MNAARIRCEDDFCFGACSLSHGPPRKRAHSSVQVITSTCERPVRPDLRLCAST
jgi:hypothetical protein